MAIYSARQSARSYGHAIGVLTLDEVAPFIPGSVGNASTFGYPVLFRCVHGLKFDHVFARDPACLPLLVAAARGLEAEGVKAITSNCGFMAHFQQAVANAVSVPVLLSSLMQLPLISASLGRERAIGIIAADQEGVTRELLTCVGLASDRPIRVHGMKDKPAFRHFLVDMRGSVDEDRVRAEAVQAAVELATAGDLGAILLECSELPPYAAAIQQATGLPTYDFITLIDYFHAVVSRSAYRGGF